MIRLFRLLLSLSFAVISSPLFAQQTDSGIAIDTQWKQAVYNFAKEKHQHTAWGLQHSERDYLLALELAEREGLDVDHDVLFAAAFLHDMGAFEPYAERGDDHSRVAAESMAEILEPAGFPMTKLELVQGAALAHMYYSAVPDEPHAQLLHDADTLNFLGAVGVTRIISLTTREALAQDLPTALATLENMSQQLPATLVLAASKQMGKERAAEMSAFLGSLKDQSANGAAL